MRKAQFSSVEAARVVELRKYYETGDRPDEYGFPLPRICGGQGIVNGFANCSQRDANEEPNLALIFRPLTAEDRARAPKRKIVRQIPK